ncbi:MAG: hypothetical protein C4339_01850 [Nitrososphaerota archaeon]
MGSRSARLWPSLALLAVALLVVSASLAAYYYVQYSSLQARYQRDLGLLRETQQRLRSLYANASGLLLPILATANTSSPQYAQLVSLLQNISATYRALRLNISVSLLIDYGNGTRAWFNGTSVSLGASFYDLTLLITGGNVNASWYPQYGSHFVLAINGVGAPGNPFTKKGWYWISWVFTGGRWQMQPVGPDLFLLDDGMIVAWKYEGPPYDTPP